MGKKPIFNHSLNFSFPKKNNPILLRPFFGLGKE